MSVSLSEQALGMAPLRRGPAAVEEAELLVTRSTKGHQMLTVRYKRIHYGPKGVAAIAASVMWTHTRLLFVIGTRYLF